MSACLEIEDLGQWRCTEHNIVKIDMAAVRVVRGTDRDLEIVDQILSEGPGSLVTPHAVPGAQGREIKRLLVPLAVSYDHAGEIVAVPATAAVLVVHDPVEYKLSPVKAGIIHAVPERHGLETAISICCCKDLRRGPAALLLRVCGLIHSGAQRLAAAGCVRLRRSGHGCAVLEGTPALSVRLEVEHHTFRDLRCRPVEAYGIHKDHTRSCALYTNAHACHGREIGAQRGQVNVPLMPRCVGEVGIVGIGNFLAIDLCKHRASRVVGIAIEVHHQRLNAIGGPILRCSPHAVCL